MSPPSVLRSRTREAVAFLKFNLVLHAAMAALLVAWLALPDGSPRAELVLGDAYVWLTRLQPPALLMTAFCFLRWLHRARVNLDVLGAGRLRNSPQWAVASWFVPLGNAVFPYEAASELWRASTRLAPPPRGGWSGGVGWWWMAWLAYTTLTAASSYAGLAVLDLWAAGFGVIAAGLALRVVRGVTARQEAAFAYAYVPAEYEPVAAYA